MLPMRRDKLRIALCPESLALVLIHDGWGTRVLGRKIIHCPPGKPEEPNWMPPVKALADILGDAPRTAKPVPLDISIILSNHFVRYALVPWTEHANGQKEIMQLARHCFTRIHGESAAKWELRLSGNRFGEPRVASAIDPGLPEAIGKIRESSRLRVRSIQPYLMAAFNQARHQINASSAWFGLAERGKLCLSRLENGQWRYLRAMKTGEEWLADLPFLLEREACLSGLDGEHGQVFIIAPSQDGPIPPLIGTWQVRHLKAPARPGFSPGDDGPLAMAAWL